MRGVLRLLLGLGVCAILLIGTVGCEPPEYESAIPGLSLEFICDELLDMDPDEAEDILIDLGVTDPLKIELLLSLNRAQNCP